MLNKNNVSPVEFVEQLQPKISSFENWVAMADLYAGAAFAYSESSTNGDEAKFYDECYKIACQKTKEVQPLENSIVLAFVAGSVSEQINGNWHAWSSDCKTFASYAEADAYATVCHNEICNQNLVGMTTFCYELRD